MKERRRDLEIRAVEETMNHDHDQSLRGRSFDLGEPERERQEGRMHNGSISKMTRNFMKHLTTRTIPGA